MTELEENLVNLSLSTLRVISELRNSFMKFIKTELFFKLDKN